jgi:serine/threonine protein kinase
VYGLGATLYEMVTGRPPFAATDRESLARQITSAEPPPPRTLDRSIPRDLETVILTALAKEPGRRYRAAADLAGEPVKARRTRPFGRGWRWCRRNPVVSGLTATVVLALAGVAVAAGVGYTHNEGRPGRVGATPRGG